MNELLRRLRERAQVIVAPRCPQDPSHGRLLSWSGEGGCDWHCPNWRHAGRPFYSQAELDSAHRR